jgi:hypothetical protein
MRTEKTFPEAFFINVDIQSTVEPVSAKEHNKTKETVLFTGYVASDSNQHRDRNCPIWIKGEKWQKGRQGEGQKARAARRGSQTTSEKKVGAFYILGGPPGRSNRTLFLAQIISVATWSQRGSCAFANSDHYLAPS